MQHQLINMIKLFDKLNIMKIIPWDPTIYWISHSKVVKQYEVDQAFSSTMEAISSMSASTRKFVEAFKELMGLR